MTMMKNYGSDAAVEEFQGGQQSVVMTVAKEAFQASRPWALVYAVMTVVAWAASYGLTGWEAMLVSVLASLVTLYITYRVALITIAVARR